MNNLEKVILFTDKKDCCACGACENICPTNAIAMKKDEYGFIYPHIDNEICIRCKKCKSVCAYQNIDENNKVEGTYVAVTKNTDILKSASGGIFASIAVKILREGGVVFGASLEQENGMLVPKHIMVDNEQDLLKLMGSKYVQSFIGTIYRDVKEQLNSGKLVLFSGTPCQVAALKSYLGKEYENLFLIDIICHGVPSASMFQDYLSILTNKNEKVINFKFREKKYGWSTIGIASIENSKGKLKELTIRGEETSYYSIFLNLISLRENCYSCKYACNRRPGDITIGDYWGIENEHPELLDCNGGPINKNRGVSVIVANTIKGKKFIESYNGLDLFESEYKKAERINDQLRNPAKVNELREFVLNLYRDEGYAAVEKWFRNKEGKRIFVNKIKRKIPSKMKENIKKVVKRD